LGRAHKVREHHGDLTTLGSILRSHNSHFRSCRVWSNGRSGLKIGYCAQNFAAITKDNTEVFQVLIAQFGKNREKRREALMQEIADPQCVSYAREREILFVWSENIKVMTMLLVIVSASATYVAADSKRYPSGGAVEKIFLVGKDASVMETGISSIRDAGWNVSVELGNIARSTTEGPFDDQLSNIGVVRMAPSSRFG
jgi:hypothetical protein